MAAETSKDSKDLKKDPLPPGMVLGPDGKPCKICTSSATFRQWKQLAAKQESQSSSSKPAGGAGATAAAAGAAVNLAPGLANAFGAKDGESTVATIVRASFQIAVDAFISDALVR